MTILGCLPIGALLLLWLVRPGKASGWGEKFLDALLAWGILVVLFTEGLSLFGLLRPTWTTILWLLLVSVLLLVFSRSRQRIRSHTSPKLAAVWAEQKVLATGLLTIWALTLLIAVVAPPNNWDSMVYHMSRVANWVQYGSVAHYPTHTDRQLYLGPFAEFAILQFQLLTGGDRFANLVQWLSMIGSHTAVFLIAKRLGANRTGQVFSVVCAATIPMGILQATSTQTDYAVTLWFACFVYFLLLDLKTPHPWHTTRLAVALGLAILTKPTAYFYAFPFLAWYAMAKMRNRPRPEMVRPVVIIGAAVLILNAGHYYRNLTWYGSLLGPTVDVDMNANGRFGVDVTLSNMIRNVALHLGTHRRDLNNLIEQAVAELHGWLGIDVNDPLTTKHPPFRLHRVLTHEDTAGNTLHLLLGSVAFFVILFHPRLRHRRELRAYVILMALAFVSFCIYNRWTPWRNRIHLPLFVLMAPVVGLVISKLLGDRYVRIAAGGLLISALPWLLANNIKPLIPISRFSNHASILTEKRFKQYFSNRPALEHQYLTAIDILSHMSCRTIGFVSGGNDWEYPLWLLLRGTRKQYTIVYPEIPLAETQYQVPDDICVLVYLGYGKAKMGDRHRAAAMYESDYLAIVRNPL